MPSYNPTATRPVNYHLANDLSLYCCQEGGTEDYVVWEAAKLNGFPIKIERRSGPRHITVVLSDYRFEVSASEYRFYDSLHSMSGELTRRISDVSRRRPTIPERQAKAVHFPAASREGTLTDYKLQSLMNSARLKTMQDRIRTDQPAAIHR